MLIAHSIGWNLGIVFSWEQHEERAANWRKNQFLTWHFDRSFFTPQRIFIHHLYRIFCIFSLIHRILSTMTMQTLERTFKHPFIWTLPLFKSVCPTYNTFFEVFSPWHPNIQQIYNVHNLHYTQTEKRWLSAELVRIFCLTGPNIYISYCTNEYVMFNKT